jgi:uncharacterized protein YciI
MKLFVVIRTHGRAWRPSKTLQQQAGWDAHAAFMDRLHDDGFIVLGGPLEGTPDVLLIIRANNRDQIVERLAADPWSKDDLLRIIQIAPSTVRLGSFS